MADTDYTGLTITVRKTPEGSHYEAGVDVNGAWFRLAVLGSGELEQRIQEAAQAAQESQTPSQ